MSISADSLSIGDWYALPVPPPASDAESADHACMDARLLEELHEEQLDHERSALEGGEDAIEKAIKHAGRRVGKWEDALGAPDKNRFELAELREAFPGIAGGGGKFRAHLGLAALAIALKRRVIVLQAVEQGQGDPENPFENFVQSLKADQCRVDELEQRVAAVLFRLSTLEVRTPSRLRATLMTRGDVEDLLTSMRRLRALGDGVQSGAAAGDVVIDIAQFGDGSVLVLPAAAVSAV